LIITKILLLTYLIKAYSFAFVPLSESDQTELRELNDSSKIELVLDEVWDKRSNDPLNAIKIANLAKSSAEKIKNYSLLAKVNNFLGVIYTNIGANEVALEYHFDALIKSKEAGDKIQKGYSYNNIGGIYRIKNDFVPASENIVSAISIFEDLKDFRGLAYCNINMGRVFKDQGNFDNSLSYFNKALSFANQINNEDLSSRILLEIADILFKKKHFEEAENIYKQLENIYQKNNYLKGLAEIWNGLSELHLNENKYNDAIKFSNNAIELNRKILNTEGEINNLNSRALIYLALNQKKSGEESLSLSLQKAIEVNDPDLLLNCYKAHYKFYKKTGDINKSFFYYEKFINLKDSVYTKEEIIKLNELESILKIEKAEKENQILQYDLNQQIIQRNYLIISIILIIFIIGIITYRFYEKKKLSEELKQINLVKDKFFKIIAHDLRGPYYAIFSGIELLKTNYDNLSEHERKSTIETIGELIKSDYDLLENLLIWAKNQGNSIEFSPVDLKVKHIINNVLKLFHNNIIRKNIAATVECADDLIVQADEQMLNTIFRNLILNSIKFSKPNGEILISVSLINNNKTEIIIKDNGIGMDTETLNGLFINPVNKSVRGTKGESGSGIGLVLVKEFIERHGGTITAESKLDEGSTFTIVLPVS